MLYLANNRLLLINNGNSLYRIEGEGDEPVDITTHPRWDYSIGYVGLDTFGFNGIPSGVKSVDGTLNSIGKNSRYWSITESSTLVWCRDLIFNFNIINRVTTNKKLGASIKLVRNYIIGDGIKEDGRILTNIFTDFNNNIYDGVIIGDQVWSTTNLKATSYLNGDPIPTGYSNVDWSNLTSGAYAVYDHTLVTGINSEQEMIDAYGLLYNWYVVDDSRGLSSEGHVPTDVEWIQLTNYLINNYNETITTFPDGSTATNIDSTNIGKHLKSIRTANP